jgi:hypothetical protein
VKVVMVVVVVIDILAATATVITAVVRFLATPANAGAIAAAVFAAMRILVPLLLLLLLLPLAQQKPTISMKVASPSSKGMDGSEARTGAEPLHCQLLYDASLELVVGKVPRVQEKKEESEL